MCAMAISGLLHLVAATQFEDRPSTSRARGRTHQQNKKALQLQRPNMAEGVDRSVACGPDLPFNLPLADSSSASTIAVKID